MDRDKKETDIFLKLSEKDFSRSDLKELLDYEASRINNLSFIEKDPVQFPRRFDRKEDIEIVSFISAIMAWGNRKMICNDIEKTVSLMDYRPYDYVIERGYEDLDPSMNLHRTFFAGHLQHLLRGFRRIYKDYGSIDDFAYAENVGQEEAPAWKLVERLQIILSEENNGETCSRCFPVNLKTAALKRVNMALRWLVRDDGIVDMGLWKSIPKSKLYIPLDIHVGNVSRKLGLLERKANDRKSVELLTAVLREMNPDDPAVYDFALFGLGIEGKNVDLAVN